MWEGQEMEVEKTFVGKFSSPDLHWNVYLLQRPDNSEPQGYLTVRYWVGIRKYSVEVSRATWEEMRIYFDGKLKATFPEWKAREHPGETEGISTGHWFMDIFEA